MALLSTQVLPDNTLEEFRIEFNKLVTDVSGLSLGNTFDTQIIFEGTTDDTFETAISVTDPTADRSIVFPNASGNVLLDSTNIALGDNIEIQFGDGTDLKIFHDGSNSIIRDNGTGALFLEGDTVSIRDEASGETMANFVSDGAVTLYHDNVAKLATASTGVEVSSSGNTQIGITSTSGIGSMEIGSAASNAAFIDLKTPTSDDFDVRLSSLSGGSGGSLTISGGTFSILGSGETMAAFADDGAVSLYYDNSAVLATASGGVSVTGTLTTSGILKTDDTTDATSTTDGSLQTDGGLSVAKDIVAGDDIRMLSDAAQIAFGVNAEINMTHVHNTGITFTHNQSGDNLPMVLQLKSEEDAIIADEVIASLEFAAGDSDGTDGATVAAGIHAIAEGTFSASANATKLVFTTGVSETAASSATAKMTLSSAGLLTIADDFVIKDAGTIGSASDTDAISISSGGVVNISATTANTSASDGALTVAGGLGVAADVSIGDDLRLISDSAVLSFGADSEVTLTHVADQGLTLKNTNTGDDKPIILTLQTGETDMAAGEVLGEIRFQAPDEGTGTDAILVAAAISARSEGDFSSSSNATKLSFQTGASEAAAEKMSLSSAGLLTVSGRLITDDTTEATSTTDGSLQTDGGLSVAKDVVAGDDVKLLSDASVIALGADGDVTITHVADTGIVLNDKDIDGVSSINTGPLGGRRNVVFNGNGAVNQRFGTSANSTINTYGPDRWRTFGGALAHSVSSKSDAGEGDGYYIRFQRTASDSQTNSTGIAQGLETKDSKHLAGQEITVSFRARAGANWSPSSGRLVCQVAGGEGTDENHVSMTNTDIIISVNADMSTGSSFATFSGSATVPSDKTQISIRFSMTPTGTAGANDYFDVRNIQLEVGGTATTFEQRQIGEELGLCQRYCVVLAPVTNGAFAPAFARTTTTCFGIVDLPVTMRSTPTLSFTAVDEYQIQKLAATVTTTNITASAELGTNMIAFEATVSSGLVAGQGMYIRDLNGGATITAAAEL